MNRRDEKRVFRMGPRWVDAHNIISGFRHNNLLNTRKRSAAAWAQRFFFSVYVRKRSTHTSVARLGIYDTHWALERFPEWVGVLLRVVDVQQRLVFRFGGSGRTTRRRRVQRCRFAAATRPVVLRIIAAHCSDTHTHTPHEHTHFARTSLSLVCRTRRVMFGVRTERYTLGYNIIIALFFFFLYFQLVDFYGHENIDNFIRIARCYTFELYTLGPYKGRFVVDGLPIGRTERSPHTERYVCRLWSSYNSADNPI